MADHPLRAILLWPIVLIVGLAIVGCVVFGVAGYIAYRLDRRRQAIAGAEYGEAHDA